MVKSIYEAWLSLELCWVGYQLGTKEKESSPASVFAKGGESASNKQMHPRTLHL